MSSAGPSETEAVVLVEESPEVIILDAPDTAKEPKPRAASIVARLMDEVVTVPGTNIKLGLDPLMGALPIGGDLLGAGIGCISLVEALRWSLPARIVWRIVGNIGINLGFGSVPILGDIFSVIFRSNSRNRDLIKNNLQEAVDSGREPSWGPVFFAILLVIFMIGAAIFVNMLLWQALLAYAGSELRAVLLPIFGS